MTKQAVTGLNHITLACHDLGASIRFYRDILGCSLRADWPDRAYLEAGSLWLCLTHQATPLAPRDDYTHIAFDCDADDFAGLAHKISEHATLWKENKSEGASIYFLDPDGHRCELHVGSLKSRLSHYGSGHIV